MPAYSRPRKAYIYTHTHTTGSIQTLIRLIANMLYTNSAQTEQGRNSGLQRRGCNRATKRDSNKLNLLIKEATSVPGIHLDSFETTIQNRTLKKIWSILHDALYRLHHILVEQRSPFSKRLTWLSNLRPFLTAAISAPPTRHPTQPPAL